MADKLLVVITSGKEDKQKAILGLMFSLHATVETKVILFGPSETLVAENDQDATPLIKQLMDKNIIPVACTNYADGNKLTDKLLAMNLKLKPVGPLISDYVREGYVTMTF